MNGQLADTEKYRIGKAWGGFAVFNYDGYRISLDGLSREDAINLMNALNNGGDVDNSMLCGGYSDSPCAAGN